MGHLSALPGEVQCWSHTTSNQQDVRSSRRLLAWCNTESSSHLCVLTWLVVHHQSVFLRVCRNLVLSIVILGDINIHLDVANNPHATTFLCSLESHDLLQYRTRPTHIVGHMIDVLIMQSDVKVSMPTVEELVISNNSFIFAELELQLDNDNPTTKVVENCRWCDFNQDNFRNDFIHSQLIANPPSDAI